MAAFTMPHLDAPYTMVHCIRTPRFYSTTERRTQTAYASNSATARRLVLHTLCRRRPSDASSKNKPRRRLRHSPYANKAAFPVGAALAWESLPSPGWSAAAQLLQTCYKTKHAEKTRSLNQLLSAEVRGDGAARLVSRLGSSPGSSVAKRIVGGFAAKNAITHGQRASIGGERLRRSTLLAVKTGRIWGQLAEGR